MKSIKVYQSTYDLLVDLMASPAKLFDDLTNYVLTLQLRLMASETFRVLFPPRRKDAEVMKFSRARLAIQKMDKVPNLEIC